MAKKIFEDGKEIANFEVDFLPSDLPKEEEKKTKNNRAQKKTQWNF